MIEKVKKHLSDKLEEALAHEIEACDCAVVRHYKLVAGVYKKILTFIEEQEKSQRS